MDTQTQKLMFSSKSNEWETPQMLFNKLDARYGFTLDACATDENHKCDKYYTLKDDGLSKSWKGERVFVNPPYGDIGKWVKKSFEESRDQNTLAVMLIPSRTDTRYWHDYVMNASTIYFIKGRLKFKNKIIADYTGKTDVSPAPFPSAVVIFGQFRWSPNPAVMTMERPA